MYLEDIGPYLAKSMIERIDLMEECGRTACKNKNPEYLNKATKKFYCESCAEVLNKLHRRQSIRLYKTPLLCEKTRKD